MRRGRGQRGRGRDEVERRAGDRGWGPRTEARTWTGLDPGWVTEGRKPEPKVARSGT